MNIALRRPRMSVEEFLAWENLREERWEFDGFEPWTMVGGTVAHNVIVGNLSFGLRQRLQVRRRVYTESVKLRLADTVRYPDVTVVCTPVANDALYVADPVVVMEVLSSTAARITGSRRIANTKRRLASAVMSCSNKRRSPLKSTRVKTIVGSAPP